MDDTVEKYEPTDEEVDAHIARTEALIELMHELFDEEEATVGEVLTTLVNLLGITITDMSDDYEECSQHAENVKEALNRLARAQFKVN